MAKTVISPAKFERIFARLRSILSKHSGSLSVTEDSAKRYCLEGPAGPAALKAWGGKMKRPRIPVAWVQIGKAYVSFHLMGLYGDSNAGHSISKLLRSRMQGKTCLNFKVWDEVLFQELERLTERGCQAFRDKGFIQ